MTSLNFAGVLHAALHARAPDMAAGPLIEIGGRSVSTLQPTPEHARAPLDVSFEEAYATLDQLPRLFIEPDGAFVWKEESPRWQIDGLLLDQGGALVSVELKLQGHPPAGVLDQILRAVGWPDSPIMFQLVALGVYLGEAEFRGMLEKN